MPMQVISGHIDMCNIGKNADSIFSGGDFADFSAKIVLFCYKYQH